MNTTPVKKFKEATIVRYSYDYDSFVYNYDLIKSRVKISIPIYDRLSNNFNKIISGLQLYTLTNGY